MPERAGVPHDDPMKSKASIFRGFLQALEREGLLTQVREHVRPETRELIDNPPPASTWMPSWPSEDVAEAVVQITGLPRWRRIAAAATRDGVVPLLRAAIEGFLRLFGAKPDSVFARMQQLTQSSTKGIEYDWRATGPRSGEMVITYPHRRDLNMATFVAAAGSFEIVFDLCGVRGVVSDPEPLPVPQKNAAMIRMHW